MVDAQENYRGVWGHGLGFGQRAALLVVDLVRAYTVEASPLFAPGVVTAVAQTAGLLDAARAAGVAIIHTTVKYNPHSFIDGGMWVRKAPVLRTLVDVPEHGRFCEGMEPLPDELVIVKQYASAFFGTSLASTLTANGIDTLLIAGCTTSGCIRATAVDTVQHGFRPLVVAECVGDRHPGPHEANLFDINAKYGDVISKADAVGYLSSLTKGE
jgi:maleamate amidohydrolase